MKKSIFFICAISAAATFSACSTAREYTIADAGEWTDGEYSATADGKNSDFEVNVVISEGYISEISIGDNSETPDIGGKAITELPDEIMEQQSYDADVISGATVTSEAIKNAVADCLEQASKQ